MAARARPGAVLARQCLQKPDAGLWRDALALRALGGGISAGVSCSALHDCDDDCNAWAESKQVPRSNLNGSFLQVVLPDGAHRSAWRHPSGSTLGCAGRAGAQRAGGEQWAQFNAWRWHKNTQQRHAAPRRPRRYQYLASGRPRPREPPPRAEAHGTGGRGTPSGSAPRK